MSVARRGRLVGVAKKFADDKEPHADARTELAGEWRRSCMRRPSSLARALPRGISALSPHFSLVPGRGRNLRASNGDIPMSVRA
jgi:hypothetical protein